MINQRNSSDFERTSTDGAVADFMMTLWTNFAKFGQVFFRDVQIFYVGKANKNHYHNQFYRKIIEVAVLSEAMAI